ncbi:MAG TPA: hypothetical protein VEW46_24065 [Pyrinomonadaceae bacterium]|nr:hypothetical protein [Pyrinomonadaceae bacterium]
MRFKDLMDNPNFISGIHNYCDRWCERCNFTARCAVYAIEEADPDINPDRCDIHNAKFWQKLSSIFKETHEMISEWAEKNGLDLSEEALAPIGEEIEKQRRHTHNHPLAQAAEKYAFAVREWFAKEFEHLQPISDMSPKLADAGEPDSAISDYVEVIQWYQFFIAAKTIRGLMSRIDEDDYSDRKDSRDSDGSAKAALIAIDRSIGAWKVVSDARPDDADAIRGFLFQLERLRSEAEREFPNARDFTRPGLDESTLDLVQ